MGEGTTEGGEVCGGMGYVRGMAQEGGQARLGEEIKFKIIELDVPLEDAIEVLEAVKIACTNAMRSAKKESVK